MKKPQNKRAAPKAAAKPRGTKQTSAGSRPTSKPGPKAPPGRKAQPAPKAPPAPKAQPGRKAQRGPKTQPGPNAKPRPRADHRASRTPVRDDAPEQGAATVCGSVALVGRPNVGKSSILNAILGQKIAATTHKPQTTRRALRGIDTRGNAQIIFVDTPGLHEEKGGLFSFMLDEALDAVEGVDVIAFVIEAHAGRGSGIHAADEEALARVESRLQRRGQGSDKKVILVINKIDVFEDKSRLLPILQAWSAKDRFVALVPISAHKKDGVRGLLDEIVRHLPEAPFVFPQESLTDESERSIAAELIREKVMLELHEELPYRAAVVVEEFDESRRSDNRKPLVHVAGVIHVEKDSQKAMVIGKGGARIKAIGQRARKDLEALLGCQVMLELLVRVEPDWTRTSAGLKKLGYVHDGR